MSTRVFNVELTDAELKAIKHEVGDDIDTWLQSYLKSRAAVAMEGMFMQEVARRLAANIPITGTKEQIILESQLPSYQERQPVMAGPLESAPTLPAPENNIEIWT